jgi:short-subunit dehydrogenase
VLVNNAGAFVPGKVIEEEDGVMEYIMQVNFFSAYHLTRKLLPLLLKSNKGQIFNLCSVAGLKSYPNGGSYSVSKHALLGFSRALREELREKNIRVTTLLPGAVFTPSWSSAGIPEERFMKVEDIADSVFDIYSLSQNTVVEEIILRPMLGDI